jgi:hypothetical protein
VGIYQEEPDDGTCQVLYRGVGSHVASVTSASVYKFRKPKCPKLGNVALSLDLLFGSVHNCFRSNGNIYVIVNGTYDPG